MCHSEVNDFLTGSHYSLFQPLGHGFLICWACKRGKKGNSHTLNECGLDLNEDARRFHTWSTLQSFVLFHISWEEKIYCFHLPYRETAFLPTCQAQPFPSPRPPIFLCHFCVILAPEPAISFGNMAEWLSGPIMPLCLEILFA